MRILLTSDLHYRLRQIDWLFGWWEQIDDWIDANRPA